MEDGGGREIIEIKRQQGKEREFERDLERLV